MSRSRNTSSSYFHFWSSFNTNLKFCLKFCLDLSSPLLYFCFALHVWRTEFFTWLTPVMCDSPTATFGGSYLLSSLTPLMCVGKILVNQQDALIFLSFSNLIRFFLAPPSSTCYQLTHQPVWTAAGRFNYFILQLIPATSPTWVCGTDG